MIDGAPRQYNVSSGPLDPSHVAPGLDGLRSRAASRRSPPARRSTSPAPRTSCSTSRSLAARMHRSQADDLRHAADHLDAGSARSPRPARAPREPQPATPGRSVVGTVYTLVVSATADLVRSWSSTARRTSSRSAARPPTRSPSASARRSLRRRLLDRSRAASLRSRRTTARVAVGPLVQVRRAATLEAPTTTGSTQIDTAPHYSTAIFTLTSDSADGLAERRALDGRDQRPHLLLPVPLDRSAARSPTSRTALASAIDADPSLSATNSGATITVTDTTTKNPFYFKVSRGGGQLAAVFDIDFANTVVGRREGSGRPAAVPVARRPHPVAPPVPPDDRPVALHGAAAFQLVDGAGNVLKTVICTITPGTTEVQGQPMRPTVCSAVADPGSRQAIDPTRASRPADGDPFLTYMFTQPGTYSIRVGAWIDTTRRPLPRRAEHGAAGPASTVSRPA